MSVPVTKIAVSAFLVIGIGAFAYNASQSSQDGTGASPLIPEFSQAAITGQKIYNNNCAKCHGPNATGTEQGPPFLHGIYNPGHHSDRSFFMAVKQGVKRHHWPFGDMPAQPQVTESDTQYIIRYVRELQKANGIGPASHN